MIVQIYEIQTPRDAEAVIALGVGHVGSVVVDETCWKQRTIRDTVDRVRALGAVSSLIPLFSREESVCRALDYYRPDIVHFCETLPETGSISEASTRCAALQAAVRRRFAGLRIMRSIPVRQPRSRPDDGSGAVRLADRFAALTDFFLTDTVLPAASADTAGAQPVSGFIGITGTVCDWRIAARLVDAAARPVILAGGLAPANVYAAVRQVRPAGVDSCSGTNALDSAGHPIRFVKDLEKVKRFVEEARRAEMDLLNDEGSKGPLRPSS